jgi:hypothetical protein
MKFCLWVSSSHLRHEHMLYRVPPGSNLLYLFRIGTIEVLALFETSRAYANVERSIKRIRSTKQI